MVQSTRPTASVVMITYLHEAFIAEAINGVLMQQCNFDVELIISDDCSPDNTKLVVESFKDHPNFKWINYIRHDSNKGMMGNYIWALEQASGKYIALCEGDDYWIDPLKLQKQVEFLEQNSLDACHTLWQENRQGEYISSGFIPNDINLGDSYIFKPKEFYYYHTSTRIVRKDVINEIMTSFPLYFLCDGPLQVVLSQRKKVGVILDYTSVYRISGSGVWTSLSLKEQALQSVNSCRDFQKYLPESAKEFAHEKWYYWLTAKFPRFLNENQRKRVSKNIMKLEFFLRKHVIEIIIHP